MGPQNPIRKPTFWGRQAITATVLLILFIGIQSSYSKVGGPNTERLESNSTPKNLIFFAQKNKNLQWRFQFLKIFAILVNLTLILEKNLSFNLSKFVFKICFF